jgi:hypothetical protein
MPGSSAYFYILYLLQCEFRSGLMCFFARRADSTMYQGYKNDSQWLP